MTTEEPGFEQVLTLLGASTDQLDGEPNNQPAADAPLQVERRSADLRFAPRRRITDDAHVEPPQSVGASLKREQIYRQALAVADGLAALVTCMITAAAWDAPLQSLFLVVPLAAILVSKIQGLYDRDDMVLRMSTRHEWRAILRANALTTMAVYLVWWAVTTGPGDHGMRVFAFMLMTLFVLSLPARAVARRLARALAPGERCVIVGAIAECARLAQRLAHVPGVVLIGVVPDDDVDCSVAGVHELAVQLDVERVIVVPHHDWQPADSARLIQSSKWLGIRVSLMPTVMNVVGAATIVDELDGMILLGVPRFGLSRSSAALKRALDLSIGSISLLVAVPVMALVALAVRLDSRGPALFRQKRIGRGGVPFTMYKFRSMVDGAERMKDQLELHEHNETAGLFKMADDPRITRVGKFIRKTYLDELPQLINVLKGEMSLVGPRPLIQSEDALLEGYDRHRSRLTPGMTGPWQLRGPLDATLPELAKLDYMYASKWSVWTDIDILLGTVGHVVTRHGH